MLGPITTARQECSVKTFKDGSNAVLVRLDDNTVFSVNKEKMVKEHVGGFGEAAGEVKVKSGRWSFRASNLWIAVKSPPRSSPEAAGCPDLQCKGSADTDRKGPARIGDDSLHHQFRLHLIHPGRQRCDSDGWTVRDTNRSDAEFRVKSFQA